MTGDEYTPTTEHIREYVEIGGEPRPWLPPTPDEDAKRAAAFDRWLAAHDVEVARAARVLPSVEDVARFEVAIRHGLSLSTALAEMFANTPSREQVEREAAEKALREAASALDLGAYYPERLSEFHNAEGAAEDWLLARADRLAGGESRG